MRSRTSSSKLRVFKKDLTRFAPTWVEYSAALLVVYYFLLEGGGDINHDGTGQEFLAWFAAANAVYGFICAVNLFGYLTAPRECNTVHAFPIRREEYFLIHTAAGLLMALVPNALFILANMPLSEDLLIPQFIGMMLEFVFFFGLAVFCMFLTGRKFAAATLYGLFNGLAALIYWAVEVIYLPSLPGIRLNHSAFFNFIPILKMIQEENQIQMICVYALVGVGLLIASLLIYRKRKLEYAGDFIAVKWLTPVFLTALSIAVGCALGAFSDLIDNGIYFMLGFGIVLGYFTGQMLLKRTIRVFNLRSVGAAAILVAVMFGSIFLTAVDPLGRVEYVPDADFVSSVQVRRYEGNTIHLNITDPAEIEKLTEMHTAILATGEFDPDISYEGTGIHLVYRLKNGQTLIRYYNATGDAEAQARFYISQPEIQLNASSLEELKKNCSMVNVHFYDSAIDEFKEVTVYREEAEALLETLFRECREGKMADNYYRENEYSVTLRDSSDNYWHYVDVTPAATDTIAMLDSLLEQEYSQSESQTEPEITQTEIID